jgi:aminobenzoyl-glutamate utilization protein B
MSRSPGTRRSFWEVAPPLALANTRADFVFTGRAAHAAASPHLGRSALDAVELMNVGVNYMREHMPSDARVHYALLDTGGIAPNVVQAHARVRYSIRARDLRGMLELVQRVKKIAEGAALMTETKVEFASSAPSPTCSPIRRWNRRCTTSWRISARRISTLPIGPSPRRSARRCRRRRSPRSGAPSAWRIAARRWPTSSSRSTPSATPAIGSTDVGDVSWAVPTVQAHAPTVAIGTPFHTWQVVSQGKQPAAHKAMVHVAKAMAALGGAVLSDPALMEAAKADHKKRLGKDGYTSPLPSEVKPPLKMSLGG